MTERTAEEWGRLAVSLPGWRWMPGMLDTKNNRWREVTLQYCQEWRDSLPYPDDPATAGCLLALLGPGVDTCSCGGSFDVTIMDSELSRPGINLGRAAIAAAAALGRWPGGEA